MIMPNVLITGARGFIGRHLAAWLAGQGHSVSGIGYGDWSEQEFVDWGLGTWVNAGVSADSLDRARELSGPPELVFHLAGGSSVGRAIADPEEDYSRTVTSTSELLAWMQRQPLAPRLVAVSSAAVYGAGHAGRIIEDAVLNPFSPYGENKLKMEEMCREHAARFGLKVAIPRLFSVYGVELRKQLLWDLCNKLAASGEIELGGNGDELRDWTHISDVVRGLALVGDLASEQAPIFNLATSIGTPVSEIALMLASSWDRTAASRISFSGQSRAGDPFSLVADTERISAQGFQALTSVRDGIAEYVDWFRQQYAAI